MPRLAVVGHVEWVDFVCVERLPDRGQITSARDAFARAAGGGGVASVVLAELGAEVDFFCALGRDAHGRAAAEQLTERGVTVHVAWREEPTRRALTLFESAGEQGESAGDRTIVTVGERLEPAGSDRLDWDLLAVADGVYFTAGDGGALRHARRAGVLVATPRARTPLESASVHLDALVFSARDLDEAEWARKLERSARLLFATAGAEGGSWWGESSGRWSAVAPPAPVHDSYGCGDSFAAGLTFGLAGGGSAAESAAIGARCGAECLTRPGAP